MNIDTNCENYKITDIIAVFGLSNDVLNKENVISKTDQLINKQSDVDARNLLSCLKTKLLAFVESDNLTSNNIPYVASFIHINSKFRKNSVYDGEFADISSPWLSTYSGTKFSINLSKKVSNISDLGLETIVIPFTWYNVDEAYKTNACWVDGVQINATSGNYTISTLLDELNNHDKLSSKLSLNLIPNTNKISIVNKTNTAVHIVFSHNDIVYRNHSLGWLLGFRNSEYIIPQGLPTTGECVFDLSGMKYMFLVIDDCINNKASSTLVTINDEAQITDIPSFFSNDLEIGRTEPSASGQVPFFFQGVPRTITQKQQYMLNEIIRARNTTSNQIKFGEGSDVLAIIPVHTTNLAFGLSTFTHTNSNQLSRKYFGKVNLEKMHVKLVNENGQVVNLNGVDWAFTLKATHLV
tara:strand:- start:220 stop:1449 length:1230 start_codon:yes stop_codon:yes gene_type:complete